MLYLEMQIQSRILDRPSKVSVRYLVILESRKGMYIFENISFDVVLLLDYKLISNYLIAKNLFLILCQHIDTFPQSSNLFINSFSLFQSRSK